MERQLTARTHADDTEQAVRQTADMAAELATVQTVMGDLVSAFATTQTDVATISRELADAQVLVDSLMHSLAAGRVQEPRCDDHLLHATVAVERRRGGDRRRAS